MTRDGSVQAIEAYLETHCGSLDGCSPYSDEVLDGFLELGPLHYFIPPSLGGRRTGAESYLNIVETTAYYSLPLGLTLGITGSLFLMPFLKHATPDLLARVIPDFLNGPALGGIMITEPTGGTDVFGLRTTIAQGDGSMTLTGRKCWGGLTGKAEHWLVAGRVVRGDRLTRSLKLLYVPRSSPGISVATTFDALGLQPIPYGETAFDDVEVPDAHNLTPKGTSVLRVMYDTLFRSRLGIAAIASGLCKRLSEEVDARAAKRVVFGGPIDRFDQVQYRLSSIRGLAQMNHCLLRFTAEWMDRHEDVSGHYVLVNAVKVVASDSMAAAADSATQLFASAAYKRNHLVGRAYVDSRPFQIFEGSNDVLHDNTFEIVAGKYGSVNSDAISQELETYGLRLPEDLPEGILAALSAAKESPQREQVQYGKIIEWIVVLAVVDHIHAKENAPVEDARRVASFHLAARLAELPYLG